MLTIIPSLFVFCRVFVVRVRVWKPYNGTYRSSRYRYASLAGHTEVPSTGVEVLQNSQKFREGVRLLYPYRVRSRTRTRRYSKRRARTPGTIVPRTYYIASKSSGYEWVSVRYIIHKSSCTGNTRENTPGVFLYVQNITLMVWRLSNHLPQIGRFSI